MWGFTIFGLHNRLDRLRPSPARLEVGPAKGNSTEGGQLHLTFFKRSSLVRKRQSFFLHGHRFLRHMVSSFLVRYRLGSKVLLEEHLTTNNRIQFLTRELALTSGMHTTTQVLNYRGNGHPNLAGARCATDVTRMRAVREDRLDRLHNRLSSILVT